MTRGTIAALLALATACSGAPPPATVPAKSPAPPSVPAGVVATRDRSAAIADEIVIRTNAERRANDLPALTRSVNLMSAAQLQAEQMASAREMSHDLPAAAYPTLRSRLTLVAYLWRAMAENIAEGQSGASAVVASWMSSPGHRANILSPTYTQVGAGVAYSRDGRPYYAEVFARPR